jgi:K+-transporting ATPase ATPase A chain
MANEIIFLFVFFGVLIALAFPIGKYMSAVFQGDKTFITPLIKPLEEFIYRISSIRQDEEMTWKHYASAFVIFNVFGMIVLFILQMVQSYLPLNPQNLANVRWDTALNTAISFMSNTNWQSYTPETTMSYLTQMAGLGVQNFLSAASGIAAQLAVTRGFTRQRTDKLGSFWTDLTRTTLYVLLPLSVVAAISFAGFGVVQNFKPYITAHTIEGATQTIASGPAASQIAIKQFGSNGGGFFNANSSHPFENPNFYTNAIETLGILLLPVALIFMFGFMLKNKKQGFAIFAAMSVLLIVGLAVAITAEYKGSPVMQQIGVENGLNMEGKEVRFGIVKSVLWGVATTATSNGSINSMHDSVFPMTSLVYLFNMGIGEVVFGGVGVGLIGMLFYIILTMFVAGLMIGRTPEFLGKKLGPYEMAMSTAALLIPMGMVLIFTAIAISTKTGLSSLNNSGTHGLSEILYAYTSACGNNGSAFAGLNANTPFYNLSTGFCMLVGRFVTIIPALAIAGSLAAKKNVPVTEATFPTTGLLFVGMLISVVFVMGALTFFPVFGIGPILEHLTLYH